MGQHASEGGEVLDLEAARASRLHRLMDGQARGKGGGLTPPSTEGLRVTVPAVPGVTEDVLLARLGELAWKHASRRERRPGEAVRMGDELIVDVLMSVQGRPVPMGSRVGQRLQMVPQPHLPGFCEGIAGTAVGSSRDVLVHLPADYPVRSLRNVMATFKVDIRAGWAVQQPDVRSPEFLRKLGRGKTVEEVLHALSQELEQEIARQVWVDAQNRVLDELAARMDVQVPGALIDQELRQRWEAGEGALLRERKVPPAQLDEALAVWLASPELRADAERRLRIGIALSAVVQRDGVTVTPQRRLAILREAAAEQGASIEDAQRALASDPEAARQFEHLALHKVAVEHVMSMAEVLFEGVSANA